jgi:hypothetical protein
MNVVINGGDGNLIFASGLGTDSVIYRPVFVPTELPNLLSWYSSDYGVYNSPGVLATEGQTVRIWQNKINNGIDLNQTTQPTYQPTYLNGAIQFAQNMMSGINTIALNSPLTYYIATQTILSGKTAGVYAPIIKQSQTINKFPYGLLVNTGAKLVARSNVSTYISNITLLNNKNIIFISFSGFQPSEPSPIVNIGTSNLSESTIFNMGINDDNIFLIGSNSATVPTVPLQGSIYEILIYTGLHTEIEKNKITNYMANKWGVSI